MWRRNAPARRTKNPSMRQITGSPRHSATGRGEHRWKSCYPCSTRSQPVQAPGARRLDPGGPAKTIPGGAPAVRSGPRRTCDNRRSLLGQNASRLVKHDSQCNHRAMGGLRLFLAISVLGIHLSVRVFSALGLHLPWWVTLGVNGQYAVLMFFIISGFLISTALADKYARGPAGLFGFYRGRLVRIFSLYWPVAALCVLLVPGAWATFQASSPLEQMSDIGVLGLDWYMLTSRLMFGLEPSWSLGTELLFYLCAPWLLRSGILAVVAALISILVRFYLYGKFGAGSMWNLMFFPSTAIFFLLGHFVRVTAVRFVWLATPAIWVPALAIWLVGTMWGGAEIAPWDGPRFWLTFLAFAVALPGLFKATRNSLIHAKLGDLSYALFLVH